MVRYIALCLFIFITSCETLVGKTVPYPPSVGRLLLYTHITSFAPPDIRFTLTGIEFKDEKGDWVKVMELPMDIASINLIDRQILIKEIPLEPGLYKVAKLHIAKAILTRGEGQINLTIPNGGEVLIPIELRIKKGQTMVTSIVWSPEESIAKDYIFRPAIQVQPQIPSPRGLLLYVSNSGSNYISVIDRGVERVIAAITVGDGPKGMAVDPSGERLYVVNTLSRTISIIDTSRFDVLDTIYLTSGIEPTDVVMMPDPINPLEWRLYITNKGSNDVSVVNISQRRISKTIPVGVSPSFIAVDTDRKEVYVTNEVSNALSIISTVDDSVIATIVVDTRPTGIILGRDKIYVLNEGSNKISVISPSSREIINTIPGGIGPRRGIQGFNNRVFIANTSTNGMTFLTSLETITRTIPLRSFPIGLVGDEKRNRLYVTNYGSDIVTVVDPIGERLIKEIFVGKNPYGAVSLER